MRFLIQRVQNASVTIEQNIVGQINRGLLVFVGISSTDDRHIADKMIDKLIKLRIFEDSAGKTNQSIVDVQGEFLIVSQFTLYADCRKGNRPSFTDAGNPDMAQSLYQYIISSVSQKGFRTEHGMFGADMKVSLLNDGPFTIILDSEDIIK